MPRDGFQKRSLDELCAVSKFILDFSMLYNFAKPIKG